MLRKHDIVIDDKIQTEHILNLDSVILARRSVDGDIVVVFQSGLVYESNSANSMSAFYAKLFWTKLHEECKPISNINSNPQGDVYAKEDSKKARQNNKK